MGFPEEPQKDLEVPTATLNPRVLSKNQKSELVSNDTFGSLLHTLRESDYTSGPGGKGWKGPCQPHTPSKMGNLKHLPSFAIFCVWLFLVPSHCPVPGTVIGFGFANLFLPISLIKFLLLLSTVGHLLFKQFFF